MGDWEIVRAKARRVVLGGEKARRVTLKLSRFAVADCEAGVFEWEIARKGARRAVLARIQAHYVGETMRYVGKAARHVEVSEYAAASL